MKLGHVLGICLVAGSVVQANGQQTNGQQANGQQKQAKQQRRSGRGYPPQMKGATEEVYKQIGDVQMRLYMFQPEQPSAQPRPAVVFFFGGGWRSGSPEQFEQHCRYLAQRGVVAMTADYRVSSRHQTKAKACVADGKSAIRWVRKNAKRLNIDPNRIAAAGGSAGGHVAACTGVLDKWDEPGEDLSISSRPDLMVLFNPAVALASVDGQRPLSEETMKSLHQRMGVEPRLLSPVHHVSERVPPTLIFHGKADETVPFRTVQWFAEAMNKAGNECQLSGFEDAGHGFFNFGRDNNRPFVKTLKEMDEFLVAYKFLADNPKQVERLLSQWRPGK